MASVDLLQREPARLLHQVDEPEVARAEHDHLLAGDVVLRPLLPCRAGRLADRVSDHRVVARRLPRSRSPCRRPGAFDQVVESVAVALLEGRALRLAVVGEDDDLVGPGGVRAGPVDAAELCVELAQRLERVRALEPRVVRDLVVARERRVDRRGGPSSCPSGRRRRSGRGRRHTAPRAGTDRGRRGGRAAARLVVAPAPRPSTRGSPPSRRARGCA